LNLAALAALVAAFASLAALVETGALTSLDQYAVDHWMSHLEPGNTSASFHVELYPKLGRPLQAFCNIWTYPAAPLVSSLIALGCCVVLVRRGRHRAALAWAGAWVLANAVEVVGKNAVTRPTLHAQAFPLRSFDSSFPSGHALRALLLAALLASVWRRTALPLLAWVVVALPALVVNDEHTPTDVIGSALLASFVVLAVHSWLRTRPVAGPGSVPRLALQTAIQEEE
jgi:membrane-associated phospholipid phosphatase